MVIFGDNDGRRVILNPSIATYRRLRDEPLWRLLTDPEHNAALEGAIAAEWEEQRLKGDSIMEDDFKPYLQPTEMIDLNHPAVAAFVQEEIRGAATPVEQAVQLYYAVRDQIRYDPYSIDLTIDGLRASSTLQNRRGWCVPKAALLAACCRRLGIPAKLGYADVKNHLSTARMRERMKTDVFIWHGYTSLFLDGKWVKATPAFNIELCRRFNLKPLAFDGRGDSIYHPFDLLGNKHMEYLRERGEFDDIPLSRIIRDFEQTYAGAEGLSDFDFEKDVHREKPLPG